MNTPLLLLACLLCAAAAGAIAYLLALSRTNGLKAECNMKDAEIKRLNADITRINTDHAAATETLRADHERDLARINADHAERIKELRNLHQQQLEQQQHTHQQQLEQQQHTHQQQLEQQMQLLREQLRTATEQLRTTSEEVLRSRSEELQQLNATQLGHILQPLKTSLADLQQLTERNDRQQTEKMARLDETIKATMQQAASVSQSADRLATALTSENKRQGNFGELQLKTLLDNMGLREGLQYDTQVTLRDDTGTTLLDPDNGQRLQPDFIVHFPEGRDLVIDAKMSLKAFSDYFNATDDAQRAEAIKRHVQSVRSHVDELARKKYHTYITGERQTVDFVVMYLYSDSALQLAMSADPELWDYAAHKGVLITGSHNLYMMLRIVVMAWDRMHQSENQQRIIEQANLIVSRVQTFYARLLDVEGLLQKTQTAFDALKTTTADRGTSIITPARTLLRLGAKEDKAKNKKALPREEEE